MVDPRDPSGRRKPDWGSRQREVSSKTGPTATVSSRTRRRPANRPRPWRPPTERTGPDMTQGHAACVARLPDRGRSANGLTPLSPVFAAPTGTYNTHSRDVVGALVRSVGVRVNVPNGQRVGRAGNVDVGLVGFTTFTRLMGRAGRYRTWVRTWSRPVLPPTAQPSFATERRGLPPPSLPNEVR